MKRAPSPVSIDCSCFKEMALVGGSSFRAACLISKSPEGPLDGVAAVLTETQVIQQIATAMKPVIDSRSSLVKNDRLIAAVRNLKPRPQFLVVFLHHGDVVSERRNTRAQVLRIRSHQKDLQILFRTILRIAERTSMCCRTSGLMNCTNKGVPRS